VDAVGVIIQEDESEDILGFGPQAGHIVIVGTIYI
jgi:hypothetical protein